MARQGHPILGVDINPYEIRVVEMRGGGLNTEVLHAGAVPTPRGALDGDRIAFPDVVAETLRGLLQRMNVSTRAAVVGIGPQSVITRVLDIPRVPDSEIRMVIEGELAHYQILREGSGAFDFVRLHEPERGPDANPQVLLMAAEERIVSDFRETADRAGLNLIALEPSLLGMYRAAFQQIQAQPSAICLSVSFGKAEIAIVDHGQIRLYRRVDIGSDDLITGRKQPPFGRVEDLIGRERVLLNEEEEPEVAPSSETHGQISSSSATTLATELQRSLDYYRREFPMAPAISRAILATNDPALEPLAEWLSEALRLDMVVAGPPIALGVSRAIAAQLEPPEGLRFMAAAGLAMRELPGQPTAVPRFNLALRERGEADVEAARRGLTVSLAISIGFVLVAIVVGLTLGRQANKMEHDVLHKRNELVGRQQLEQARVDSIIRQADHLRALKMEGFPFPRIMDAIANAVDPQAGLTRVSLDHNGRLTVAGEAATDAAVVRTLSGLQLCPYFENTMLESWERDERIVRFRVLSQLIGVRPLAAPSSTSQ